MPDDFDLQLQRMMAQFQPTPEEIERAKRERMLAAGFGLLGTRKGQEFENIGRAGLFGQGVYNDTVGEGVRGRQQAMQSAAQAMQLQQQMRALQQQNATTETLRANPFNAGGVPGQSQQSTLPAGAVGGSGMGGGTATLFGGGSQPGPVAGPTRQQPADPVAVAQARMEHMQRLADANPGNAQIAKMAQDALEALTKILIMRKTSGQVQTMRDPNTGQLYGAQGMEYADPRRVADVPAEKIDYVNAGGTVDPRGSLSGQLLAPQIPVTMSQKDIAANRVAEGNLAVNRGQLAVSQGNAALQRENAGRTWDSTSGQWIYAPSKDQPARAVTPEGYESKKAAPEAYTKQVSGITNLNTAINEYMTELQGWNSLKQGSPSARASMGSKYNNMMLQAKEAYNLGVLNGPDYSILQEVVTNPLSWTGAITPNDAMGKQATELQRIQQQNADNLAKVYKQPQQPRLPRSPQEASGKITVSPLVNQLLDKYAPVTR